MNELKCITLYKIAFRACVRPSVRLLVHQRTGKGWKRQGRATLLEIPDKGKKRLEREIKGGKRQ